MLGPRQSTPVEIKSASTFSPHFLKGLERFHALGAGPCAPGLVLYNGEPRLTVNSIRIFNPLAVEDLTAELLGPPGREKGAPAS